MNNAPYYYDYVNTYNGSISPSTVHIHNTGLSRFFRNYLLQRAMSVFEWDMPEYWSKDYFLYCLYGGGFVAVINTDRFGVIPQFCGLYGYDVFYRPTNATIANPLLKGILHPRIGLECELVRLQPNYRGCMDIINYYGDMLALAAEAGGVNLINSKLAYLFVSDSKQGAESFKKLYDRIASGEPAVVYDKSLTDDGAEHWKPFSQSIRTNFIMPELLDAMREIRNQFDEEIGIPSVSEKKERLITDESTKNNISTYSLASLWKTTIDDCCKKINNMFGIGLKASWRFEPAVGGENNASNSHNNGIV